MKSIGLKKFACLFLLAGFFFVLPSLVAESKDSDIHKIYLPLPPDIIRADLYYLRPDSPLSTANPSPPGHSSTLKADTAPNTPRAVLVLCPGANGNGEALIRQHPWQDFARQHRLGLVGLSFASSGEFLNKGGRGYYYASKGSGQALLDGIRQIYGHDLPLLLYGFSGGAHFTSRVAEWAPERVLTWCAYSAAWWDTPQKATINPPGLVACGENDPRYGASLIYFKQGRAAGKPWLWISLANTGHNPTDELNAFVRHYFTAILKSPRIEAKTVSVAANKPAAKIEDEPSKTAANVKLFQQSALISNTTSDTSIPESQGLWLDIDFKTVIVAPQAARQPSLSAWLPAQELLSEWNRIHKP